VTDPRSPEDVGNLRAAKLQGGYYVLTGMWPVLSRRSFEAVTGRKQDFWLARTVGLLAAAVGAGLLQSARARRGVPEELRTTAACAAIAFVAVDVIGVAAGRIRPVYLVDAAAEVALLGLWRRSP
jgi:hypothetical protein